MCCFSFATLAGFGLMVICFSLGFFVVCVVCLLYSDAFEFVCSCLLDGFVWRLVGLLLDGAGELLCFWCFGLVGFVNFCGVTGFGFCGCVF